MHLESLTIRAFRNLAPASLALGPGFNFFFGANGQGKTNLLEACALLVNGASPRTSVLADTIPWEGEATDLGGVEEAYGVRYRIGLVVRPRGKTIQVDGVARRQLPGVAQGCFALTFLPEDLEILAGEPSLRRHFLDSALSYLEPSHAADLRAYQGALLSRTRVLKELGSAGGRRAELDRLLSPYESLLVANGQRITTRRAQLVSLLAEALSIATIEHDIPLSIRARYEPHVPEYLEGDTEGALARLIGRREVDILQKRTTVGPHRDELTVECKGAGVRAFASRGETRLVMVLLLIAKLRVMMARLGFTPLIILDDIFSELDRERRQLVIAALPRDAQVLCSAVEADLHREWLSAHAEARLFRVEGGTISP